MTLGQGTRLGPYEILSPLGAGGMGEVYRAKDTRLGREVAVKVLPAHMADSPELRERFEREAKAVAALSHPNICSLYDVGREADTDFLVMELLEGESLADRLQKGPLPLDQVLQYGVQIAAALDRAHHGGVVHRDLKPGNIMVTRSGVKLLDFGLAKLRESAAPAAGLLTSLPTTGPQAKPLTKEGTLMGTFQFMSPEQLEGAEVDARSDLFSFGAVLYEMVTGRRAFDGKSQASLIAAILNKNPEPISVLQPMTPPALERVVLTCLAKDPEDRWQSAREVMHQLQWIAEGGSQAGVPAPVSSRRKSRQRLAWGIAAASALLALALGAAYARRASVRPRAVRSYILPPEKSSFSFDAATGGPALSPDGTRVVFAAIDATGKKLLWIRPLDSLTAQPLEGTEDASFPFWSPDSRFVGFFVTGKLKKIDAFGGPPQSVCAAANGRGGTWSPRGVIIFAPDISGGLQRVPSAGGAPSDLLAPDKNRQQSSLRWPLFLPDGKHFIVWGGNPLASAQETNGLYVGALDEKEARFLFQSDSDGLYVAPGYLLFLRDRSLMAQPFDAGSRKTTGDAFPLAEEVANPQNYRLGCFSASQDGSLVYQTGENGREQVVWVNASGGDSAPVGDMANVISMRLSPDGARLAEALLDSQTRNVDLWLVDLARSVKTRFTFDPAIDNFPVWSPDGARIAYSSNPKTHFDIYVKSATGAGDPVLLLTSDADKYVTDWSRDGQYLAFTQLDAKGKTGADIFILPFTGDRKPYAFLQTTFNEGNAVFSPDGHWIAYMSNESGKVEIYLTPFPQASGKWQVSQGGGEEPRWRHDGKGLYFRTPDGKLMEASVTPGAGAVQVGTPAQVAKIQLGEFSANLWVYGPAPKEDRFLILRPERTESAPLTLVTHWPEGVKR